MLLCAQNDCYHNKIKLKNLYNQPLIKSRSFTMTAEKALQRNLLALFERQNSADSASIAALNDCVLEFQDGAYEDRIYAHKAVLAAQSEWFRTQLAQPGALTLTLSGKKRSVFMNVIRFCYFGKIDSNLSPTDLLDVFVEARLLGIEAIKEVDVDAQILQNLTLENCIEIATHEELKYNARLARVVSEFVAGSFFELLKRGNIK